MTKIEWTDETWNPVTGCDQISPGCDNCYALTMAKRLKAMGSAHYQNDGDPRTSGPGFGVTVHPDMMSRPLAWKKPRKVFVNSMSDLFHPAVPDGAIAWVWHTMALAGQHTFQVLTKRPQRMAEWVERWNDLSGETFEPKLVRGPDATREAHPSGRGQLFAAMLDEMGAPPEGFTYPTFDWMNGPLRWGTHPLPNVWLGTSIESDRYAFRADHLRRTPAAVRFISAEPLLGPLPSLDLSGIDWLIVGGESGRGARPMHPDWVRDLRNRCLVWACPSCLSRRVASFREAHHGGGYRVACHDCGHEWDHKTWRADPDDRKVPAFFFKQWGQWFPFGEADADGLVNLTSHGKKPGHWLEDGPMVRLGKKAAGRMLDGRTWDEMPEAGR